jgi:hypothetical protein
MTFNSGILLYKRYVDDILIISQYSTQEMDTFMESLKNIFQLQLTATHNTLSVDFLDITITFNLFKRRFNIRPYSKNRIMYPFPTLFGRRGFMVDYNIIRGQFLRTWRLSTDSQHFSRSIITYFRDFPIRRYYLNLMKGLLKFLQPIQVNRFLWSTKIPICMGCKSIICMTNVKIKKILQFDGKLISSKEPINCLSENIFLIIQDDQSTRIELTTSLHSYLKKENTDVIDILPFGRLNILKMQSFLTKHPNIYYRHRNDIMAEKTRYNCHIHDIFKNSASIYGISTNKRRKPNISNMFGKYRKLSLWK